VARRPKDPNEPSRAEKVAQTSAQKARAARIAKIERAVVVISVVVGLGAAGVIWKNHHHGSGGTDPTVKALRDIGVTPFVACGMPQPTTDGPGQDEVTPPGQTPNPTVSPSASPQPQDEVVPPGTKVRYSTVPPSYGPHLAAPVAVNAAGFYTAADRPPMEGLVANLNAGWTVLWYDSAALGPDQVSKIQKAAGLLHNDKRYSTFVASEWDGSYGAMPDGTPLALVRWTKQGGPTPAGGHRAFCHETSGESFLQFMIAYGAPVPSGEQD
jgi:hypothetical protein